MEFLAAIGLLWIGWLLGWRHAHITVAAECERLGAFYVGKTVYRCTAIEPKEEPSE
ncbi:MULTISPECIES: hypothetical protein [Pseudomonadaceae]|uniref:Uncharacterized protein n=1 Tax=Pseudomonas sihuiensis TaxID=1274359 RepID=A0A1H2LPG2_9PSED|nr:MULTISPECIES: hypothetical protein [Pseudomonas]MDH0958957.1 hypothetical protein [Pseudomonas chengduensis]SDU82236.1 hypothetical protein SAMN05216363_1886 [Pseudomonas sihuiensis]